MLLVGGVISIFGTVSGDLLCTPRVIFAAARDGNLPRFLARIHPKYRTPHVAIMAFAAIIAAFALTGTFKPLAAVASGSILTVYAGVCLAVLRVRKRDGLPAAGQFRLPFGPLIPILACLVVAWLLLQLTLEEATSFAVLIGAAGGVYGIRTMVRKR